MEYRCPVYQGHNFRISILTDRLIRFEFQKSGNFLDNKTNFAINRDFAGGKVELQEDEHLIVITSKYFTLQYSKGKPFKGTKLSPDANLRVKLANTEKIWYPDHPEARNFKASAFSLDDMKDIKLDKGLYSTDGFVMIDDSDSYIINETGLLERRVDGGEDFYLFMYKRDFGFCLNDYFRLTGFPPMLPKYALGIWWNRDTIYRDVDVNLITQLFEKYDIPLSVILLSEFWHTKDERDMNLYKSGYSFNKSFFPNPIEFTSNLHSKNIKLGLNLDPTEGVRPEEPVYKDFILPMNLPNGENIPFNIHDHTFAALFLTKVIKPLKDEGVDFFWVDYKNDRKTLEALNYYVMNSPTNNNQRQFMLSRNSNVASHRYTALYSGETTVEWSTLKYIPSYTSNAANIGLSWWSHDVGGFKDGTEDSELYLRYVQYSTFSPIFRFSAKRGLYYKREPWSWDIKTLTLVRKYCDLRYKLIPYLYSECYKYHKMGMPLIKPLYYENPAIYDEPTFKNEYHFGTEFLVSPITKPSDPTMNRSIEKIYIPEGTWYDFTTGKKFIGDKRYVTFYKDEDFPVFVKAGAIIPMSILSEKKNDLSNKDTIEVNVFPGKSNQYTLYEDDGETNDYLNGKYLTTSFDYNYMLNNYTLIIRPLDGDIETVGKLRNYIIKFRNTKHAEDVTLKLNGEIFENFTTNFDETNFIIDIKEVDISKQLTINCKGRDIEINASRIFEEDVSMIIYDLELKTSLKEEVAGIMFNPNLDIREKRIMVNKLKRKGLPPRFATMFLKLLEFELGI